MGNVFGQYMYLHPSAENTRTLKTSNMNCAKFWCVFVCVCFADYVAMDGVFVLLGSRSEQHTLRQKTQIRTGICRFSDQQLELWLVSACHCLNVFTRFCRHAWCFTRIKIRSGRQRQHYKMQIRTGIWRFLAFQHQLLTAPACVCLLVSL